MSIMALTGGLRVHTLRYLILYAVAATGYLVLVGGRRPTLSVRTFVLLGLALRLLFLLQAPTLSDDYHRYLWDGQVQLAGINPYLYAPADPHLDGVPYRDRGLINHQHTNTIYPASAQVLFWGMARVGVRSALTLKLVLGAFELLTAWLIWRLAGAWRERALAVYLLNPLVIQETWSSAHVEAAAVCLAVAAALLLVRSRDLLAGVALGFAAGVKLTPAVLLIPALIGRRARPLPLLAGFAAAFALPYVPYALSGAVLGSLSQTNATPRSNDAGFALLSLVLPYEVARIVAAALFILGAVLVSRRLSGREQTAAAFTWTATLFLLLLPVVYPWYWLTAVAFAAAAQVRLPTLLGLFSPASYGSYAPLLAGRRPLLRVIAWVPLVTARRDLRRLRRPGEPDVVTPGPPGTPGTPAVAAAPPAPDAPS
jgi:Glycosyltransferase family 87